MAEITATIEDFCKTYLEQRKDNAWDRRASGPLGENCWAQKALEELLLPKGYNRMKEAGEENTGFVRDNSNGSIDRVFFGNAIKYYEQRFGERHVSKERANVLAHLRFANLAEAERYTQLEDKMHDISEQEGITHRVEEFGEYRPVYAFFGGVAGGVLSFIPAAAPIPWKELIGLDPGPAHSVVVLLGLTVGGISGWYLGKHKENQMDKYRTKLKRDYDQLFQEFKDTFGPRFTYGKEALSAALQEG